MKPGTQMNFGLKIKWKRLVYGMFYSVMAAEVFVLLALVVANSRIGVLALWQMYKPDFGFLELQQLLGLVTWDIGIFMISVWNIGVIMSVIAVYSIHGSQATVKKQLPIKRYQYLTMFWSRHEIFCIVTMSVACTIFAQCVMGILGLNLFDKYIPKDNNVSSQDAAMDYKNQKNIFVILLTLILTFGAYLDKRISTNGYKLKFYQMPKKSLDHLYDYFMKHPLRPLRNCVTAFPILLIVCHVCKILFPTMNVWTGTLDFEIIAKSLVGSYLGLTIFRLQWFCVNLFLVQKPNAEMYYILPSHRSEINLNYLSSYDDYVQYLGWYDLYCRTQNSQPLSNIFVLSHPGNKAYIWRGTLNQCLRVSANTLRMFRAFIDMHIGRFKAATATYPTLTMDIPSFTFAVRPADLTPFYDNVHRSEQSHVPDRDLICDKSLTPLCPEYTDLPKSGFVSACLRILFNAIQIVFSYIIKNNILNKMLSKMIRGLHWIIKQNKLWNYLAEPDFDLHFSNVLTEYALMAWSISTIVKAIDAASSSGNLNIILQDIENINRFFVDTCETIGKLGRLVPKKFGRSKRTGVLDEIDFHTKTEYKRLKNIIMFEMCKYYTLVSPLFGKLMLNEEVLEQMQQFMKNSDCWGQSEDKYWFEKRGLWF